MRKSPFRFANIHHYLGEESPKTHGYALLNKSKEKMKKICKSCGKEFEVHDKKLRGRGRRSSYKRPLNCVTCSLKCSKENTDKWG